MDFSHTRQLLDALPHWLTQLSKACGEPVREAGDGGVQYRFTEQSPHVVQVAKAVRMVSGLRAAMHLADLGHTVEAASLLRVVTDFAHEILAVGEGVARGKFTAAQQKFIDDFFRPLPATLDEFLDSQAQSYVGREDLYKAHKRFGQDASVDPEELVGLRRFLDRGYDSYVHGGYATAMELYDPSTRSFSVAGTPSTRNRCICKVAIAGKLYFCILAMELMARLRDLGNLASDMKKARDKFEHAPEYNGSVCDEL